eukprot:jgi/Tetstr1/442731/TSEL_030821.t1
MLLRGCGSTDGAMATKLPPSRWAALRCPPGSPRRDRLRRPSPSGQRRASSRHGENGGTTTYEGLKRVDGVWEAIRNQPTGAAAGPPPQFVKEVASSLGAGPDFDVVLSGGTLGIFIATVLQLQGLKVAVIERGPLAGRSQGYVDQGRAHLGVSPAKLIAHARERFESAGGRVLEKCGVQGVEVHPDGAKLLLDAEESELSARLVLDCMGHGSPITRQLRWGNKPDGMCLVDRTTYMFTYLDAEPHRPSLEALLRTTGG